MSVSTRPHPFTVDEFHRMVEAGILRDDQRVELIDGEIVDMTPIGPRHAACVRRLTSLLVQRVGDQALVSVQNPIRLGERSEPQPDLALLRPQADGYKIAHPSGADTILMVEVAESPAATAVRKELASYALGGVAEAWVVDLPGERVERYRHPSGDRYGTREFLSSGDRLAIERLSGVTLAVEELLP